MLSKILNEIIRERKEKRIAAEKDLLEYLLNSKDGNDEVLSEDQIADNIIGVLFAAQDTTASVMTWIIKYLYDNLKLLEAVKVCINKQKNVQFCLLLASFHDVVFTDCRLNRRQFTNPMSTRIVAI